MTPEEIFKLRAKYLSDPEYYRYKRKERLHLIAIIITCIILAGVVYLLLTSDLDKLDAWMQ